MPDPAQNPNPNDAAMESMAAQIRAQYPEYEAVNDRDLVARFRGKYPRGLPGLLDDLGGDPAKNLSPQGQGEIGSQVRDALPGVAGMVASAIPVPGVGTLARTGIRMLTTGLAGSTGEAARETIAGEPLDSGKIAGEGLLQAGPAGIQGLAEGAGKMGTSLLQRSVRSGRATTAGEGWSNNFDVKGLPVAAKDLGAKNLTEFADTMAKYKITVSKGGFERANQVVNDLQTAAAKAVPGSAQESAILGEIQKVKSLMPEIRDVANSQVGAAGMSRGALGAGVVRGGAMTGGAVLAGMGAGLDPATIAIIAGVVGIPAGMVEASPYYRSLAGIALRQAKATGKPLELVTRGIITDLDMRNKAGQRGGMR